MPFSSVEGQVLLLVSLYQAARGVRVQVVTLLYRWMAPSWPPWRQGDHIPNAVTIQVYSNVREVSVPAIRKQKQAAPLRTEV